MDSADDLGYTCRQYRTDHAHQKEAPMTTACTAPATSVCAPVTR